MKILKDVLENYENSRAAKVASKTGSPDQKAILEYLPKFFSQVIAKNRNISEFKVEGSIGNGNVARVPWVGVFNRSVTTSAQNGYYIVLLFAQDLQSCTLSLNQGITSFVKKYSQKIAQIKAREYAARAAQCFPVAPGAILGPIDLAADGDLGMGYQLAAIESFRYEIDDLPSAEVLSAHFEQLLNHYDRLIQVAGPSLQSLVQVTEQEYQKAVQEIAVDSKNKNKIPPLLNDTPKPKPLPISTAAGKAYPRDPKVASRALLAANYLCEVDSAHKTFISHAKKRPYIEAHHLIPIALQDHFEQSLDVAANVVGLCPLCHKMLHLGRPLDKKPLLFKLYGERIKRLSDAGINIDMATLEQYYKLEILEDDA